MASILSLNRLARYPAQVMAVVVCGLLAAVIAFAWQFGVKGLRISVQDSTEASNRTLTRVFVNENWDVVKPLLPPPGSNADTAKANPNIDAIDQVVRRFSSYTDVLKVKIYDLNGITVYSSERKQIGEDKARNGGFQIAARGGVASELTYRGAFGAFDGEKYDRNLVSTYVPVRVGERVEAVLEIYSDRTASIEFVNRELRDLALSMAPWVVVALLIVAVVGRWLHRAQLAAARAMAVAEDQARHREGQAAAAQAEAGGLLERLPVAFEGLDALIVRLREAGGAAVALSGSASSAGPSSTPAGPPGTLASSAEWAELLARFSMIERWAVVRRDLAGVRQGREGAAPEDFDLDAVVDEVLQAAERQAGWQGWTLTGFRHPARLGTVRGDRAGVRTVLTHLIGASLDAPAPAGMAGQVQCKLLREGTQLQIDIVDNSAGMDPAQIERWFRDWDENHTLPPADANGLCGWRLLLVRSWLLPRGGRFDARSTPGLGHRWSVQLTLDPR